ncbi:hypothetical protein EWM64_g9619 [Hericium alpestre]|uniref:Uncharacterized protein n=1 Tax=Hericium alpestre TaxID=135208 RepID=A0A4Y9ZIW6_9AGAM|nr:hypothetical protein EWM64_g9619 [Hericium alpestre]
MRITTLFAPLLVFVLSPAVHGIDVDWYSAHSCEGASQYAYRNVACNTCISPPFGTLRPSARAPPLTDMI